MFTQNLTEENYAGYLRIHDAKRKPNDVSPSEESRVGWVTVFDGIVAFEQIPDYLDGRIALHVEFVTCNTTVVATYLDIDTDFKIVTTCFDFSNWSRKQTNEFLKEQGHEPYYTEAPVWLLEGQASPL